MGQTADDDAPGHGHDVLERTTRGGRRLSDKILVAFHHACDAGDLTVAEQLLRTVETLLGREGGEQNRRRSVETLVAAHERLWHLRRKE